MAQKKILIVEDEVELVKMLKYRLEASQYSVTVAYDGQQALDAVQRERPDIILLDVVLPRVDGYKVCSTIKKDPVLANVPVIIFSALAQDADKAIGIEVGADDYITKPFDSKLLLEKIKNLLNP